MTGFSTLTLCVESTDGHNFSLLEPFTFTSSKGEVIEVPAGTKTDGATTPRALWPTLPPFGTYWRAAVLHDYLYRDSKRPKAECDSLLLDAMQLIGVDSGIRTVIYEGVHLGGWGAFDYDREQLLAAAAASSNT